MDSGHSRRSVLKAAVAAAGALTPVAAGAGQSAPAAGTGLLPTVKFGKFHVTRLIIGSNQFYGYSHFNKLLDAHMREWYTPERVTQVLLSAERNGINTWQVHYSDRFATDYRNMREAGGKLQFFLLHDGAMRTDWKLVKEIAKLGPIGIAHHGNQTDNLFREGRMNEVRDFLKAVRDSGVMVGLSCHNPAVIDYVEGNGWDIDYYQACFYNAGRSREEIRAASGGNTPLGELYLEEDPPRMCKMIQQTRKPVLGFKILAAGRTIGTPEQVDKAFEFAFQNMKPTDCVIVGMYPRYRDEVQENAQRVRRLLA
jgi:hypothetical protein